MILGLLWQIRSSLYSNPPAVASLPAAAECATANVGMIGGKGAAAGGGAGTSEVHQVQHKVQHEGASAEEAGGGGGGGAGGGGGGEEAAGDAARSKAAIFSKSSV